MSAPAARLRRSRPAIGIRRNPADRR